MKKLKALAFLITGFLIMAGFTVIFSKLAPAGEKQIPVMAVPSEATASQEKKANEWEFQGALDIRIHPQEGKLTPPAELLLSDPQGKKIGKDPFLGKSYLEIPRAYYEREGLDDAETGEPGPESAIINIRHPANGRYRLQVMGTDTAQYTLEVMAYDRAMNTSKALFTNIGIQQGMQHHYVITYSNKPGAKVEVRPGLTSP